MKRIGMIVIAMHRTDGRCGLCAGGPARRLPGPGNKPRAAKQAPLQNSIVDLYLSDLKNEVGLSDDQFLKVRADCPAGSSSSRFQSPIRDRILDERQDQLLSQPNPSLRPNLQKLNDDLASLDDGSGRWRSRSCRNLQRAISPSTQAACARISTDSSSDEKLPSMLERLRAAQAIERHARTAGRGARANQQNRKGPGTQRPANTLRGRRATGQTPLAET